MGALAASMPVEPEPEWAKTARQREALDLMNDNTHTLLYGGSRSGKTFIIIRNILIRALLKPSRHLICRLRFNHVKVSIYYDTFMKVMETCFPGVEYEVNRSEWFIRLTTVEGGHSEIWLSGSDDPARMEKVLGTEYSTIFLNEISQIPWEVAQTMWTRLAESSGLPLRFYYDCNPPFKRHWSYTMFFQSKSPTGEALLERSEVSDPDSRMVPMQTARLLMNPVDNPNLPDQYLAILDTLPKRARDRYRDGIFLSDVEGALWTDDMCIAALQRGRGEVVQSVVALDPAVTGDATSNEWGIVVCGKDEYGAGGIIEDASEALSVGDAAHKAVALYRRHECNAIVAETNQGGDMIAAMIHNVDPQIKVIGVRASKGKFARAEPVAQLYEDGKVWHDQVMPELEDQFTTYVQDKFKSSPDRLDAAVWGLTHLVVGKGSGSFHFG